MLVVIKDRLPEAANPAEWAMDLYGPTMVVDPGLKGEGKQLVASTVAKWPGPVVANADFSLLFGSTGRSIVEQRKEKGTVYWFSPSERRWHEWGMMLGLTPVVWDPVRLIATNPIKEYADLLASLAVGPVCSSAEKGTQRAMARLLQGFVSDMLMVAHETGEPLSTVLDWLRKVESFVDLATDSTVCSQLSPETSAGLTKLALEVARDTRLPAAIEALLKVLVEGLEWTATAEGAETEKLGLFPVDVGWNGNVDTLLMAEPSVDMVGEAEVYGSALRHLFRLIETVMGSDGTGLDPGKTYSNPLFALSDFARLARPINNMPDVLATVRSRAAYIFEVSNRDELVKSWGEQGADIIMGSCGTKIIFPDPDARRVTDDPIVVAINSMAATTLKERHVSDT